MGNSRYDSGVPVCEHGSLYRSCEICERDREIAELRAENERLRDMATYWKNLQNDYAREIELRKHDKEDAERYRWLRDHGPDNGYWVWEDQRDGGNGRLNHEWVGRIIDAAMRGEEE